MSTRYKRSARDAALLERALAAEHLRKLAAKRISIPDGFEVNDRLQQAGAAQPPKVPDEAQSRAEFEEWQREDHNAGYFVRNKSGEYVCELTQDDWNLWQASRAALKREK